MKKASSLAALLFAFAISAEATPILDTQFTQGPSDPWTFDLVMTAIDIPVGATTRSFYFDNQYAGGFPDSWVESINGPIAAHYRAVMDINTQLPFWFSFGVPHTTAFSYVFGGQTITLQGSSYTVTQPTTPVPNRMPDAGPGALAVLSLAGLCVWHRRFHGAVRA